MDRRHTLIMALLKGGEGSGFYGHAGRIGERGGSLPRDAAAGGGSEAADTDTGLRAAESQPVYDEGLIDDEGNPYIVNGFDTRKVPPEVRAAAKAHIATYRVSEASLVKELKGIAVEGAAVTSRLKGTSSLLEKIVRKGKDMEKLTDVLGTRIVTTNLTKCWEQVEAIRAHFGDRVKEEEDYIEGSKGGYHSYHFLVESEDGKVAELQVRTARMNQHADWNHVYVLKEPAMASDKTVIDYTTKLGDAMYAKDRGEEVDLPPCPPVLARDGHCFEEAD